MYVYAYIDKNNDVKLLSWGFSSGRFDPIRTPKACPEGGFI